MRLCLLSHSEPNYLHVAQTRSSIPPSLFGCPTAYRLKYRGGGLAKMQLLPSIMPSVGSFGTSAENKAFRIKSLLGK